MEKVIAAIRFKELDSATASDIELLMNHNKIKETAKRHAVSMTLAAGGREIGEHESDIIIELPIEQADVIRDIHSRIQDDLETSTTIGVGDELKDAKLALDWAVKNRPGTIKVMEPMIAETKASSDDEDKYDYQEPEQVAIEQESRPIPIHKSEDDKEDWADDSESIAPETKEKIATIVKMLQEKREYLQQLQQTNPDIYAGVVGVVQSISAMAQAAKDQDAKKHSKMMTKIARHIDKASEDSLDSEAANVLEMLIEAQKDADEEHKAHVDMLYRKHKQKYDYRHKHARDHAAKTGIDAKFLLNLHKLTRG